MKRTISSVAALALAAGAVSACAQTPQAPHDALIAYGDGVAQVHAPALHDTIGVVVLHSLNRDNTEPVRQGWSSLSDRKRFVALYLDRQREWNAGLCCGTAALSNRDDIGWLKSVVADLTRRYHLTTVFLVGNSNGGMMAETLLQALPGTFAGAVVWAGSPEMKTEPVGDGYAGPLTVFDGALDGTVPRLGGISTIAHQSVTVRPYSATSTYLPQASLHSVVVEGEGHPAPAGWPAIAWRALNP